MRTPSDGATGGLCVVALAMSQPWPSAVTRRVLLGFRRSHPGSPAAHVFVVMGRKGTPFGVREQQASEVRMDAASAHAELLPVDPGLITRHARDRVLLGGALEALPNIVGGRETGSRPLLPTSPEERLAVLASLIHWADEPPDLQGARRLASSPKQVAVFLRDKVHVEGGGVRCSLAPDPFLPLAEFDNVSLSGYQDGDES